MFYWDTANCWVIIVLKLTATNWIFPRSKRCIGKKTSLVEELYQIRHCIQEFPHDPQNLIQNISKHRGKVSHHSWPCLQTLLVTNTEIPLIPEEASIRKTNASRSNRLGELCSLMTASLVRQRSHLWAVCSYHSDYFWLLGKEDLGALVPHYHWGCGAAAAITRLPCCPRSEAFSTSTQTMWQLVTALL